MPVSCLFRVEIADGMGDLYHYFDFISMLGPAELENAYFIISVGDETKLKRVKEEINNLDPKHPLRLQLKNVYFNVYNIKSNAESSGLSSLFSNFSFWSRPDKDKDKDKDKEVMANTGSEETIAKLLREKIKGMICEYFVSYGGVSDSFEKQLQSDDYIFRATLREHGPAIRKTKFLNLNNSLSIGENGVGIFIPDSESELLVDEGLLSQLKIDPNSVLTICCSHMTPETHIQLLCKMHVLKQSNKPLTIFFPQGLPIYSLSDKTNNLLKEANCTLLESRGQWVTHKSFMQLRIQQAKTSLCGLASGDKGTERCFAEGFFPIIEFHEERKKDFWDELVVILKGLQTNNNLTAAQITSCIKIVDYINAGLEYNIQAKEIVDYDLYPPDPYGYWYRSDNFLKIFSDTPSNLESASVPLFLATEQLDIDCFTFWKEVVCPRIRNTNTVRDTIPRNVQVFKMLVALNGNSEDSINAQGFFKNMHINTYNNLIDDLCQQCLSADYFETDYYMVNAQHLRNLLKIRTTNVNPEMLTKINEKAMKFLASNFKNVETKLKH